MIRSDIGSEKYVSLTTFRRDGTERSVPVWIADLDGGKVGFTAEIDSFKTKRIDADGRVLLQPCNVRGRVDEDASVLSGTAVVVTGSGADAVAAAIAEKYRWQHRLLRLQRSIAARFGREHADSCGIVIELGT
jgi:PPOX class probable F420-dependent enzyme